MLEPFNATGSVLELADLSQNGSPDVCCCQLVDPKFYCSPARFKLPKSNAPSAAQGWDLVNLKIVSYFDVFEKVFLLFLCQ